MTLPQIYTWLYYRYICDFTTDIYVTLLQIYTWLYHRYIRDFTTDIYVTLPQIYTWLYHRYIRYFTTDIYVTLPQIYMWLYYRYIRYLRVYIWYLRVNPLSGFLPLGHLCLDVVEVTFSCRTLVFWPVSARSDSRLLHLDKLDKKKQLSKGHNSWTPGRQNSFSNLTEILCP